MNAIMSPDAECTECAEERATLLDGKWATICVFCGSKF